MINESLKKIIVNRRFHRIQKNMYILNIPKNEIFRNIYLRKKSYTYLNILFCLYSNHLFVQINLLENQWRIDGKAGQG